MSSTGKMVGVAIVAIIIGIGIGYGISGSDSETTSAPTTIVQEPTGLSGEITIGLILNDANRNKIYYVRAC